VTGLENLLLLLARPLRTDEHWLIAAICGRFSWGRLGISAVPEFHSAIHPGIAFLWHHTRVVDQQCRSPLTPDHLRDDPQSIWQMVIPASIHQRCFQVVSPFLPILRNRKMADHQR